MGCLIDNVRARLLEWVLEQTVPSPSLLERKVMRAPVDTGGRMLWQWPSGCRTRSGIWAVDAVCARAGGRRE